VSIIVVDFSNCFGEKLPRLICGSLGLDVLHVNSVQTPDSYDNYLPIAAVSGKEMSAGPNQYKGHTHYLWLWFPGYRALETLALGHLRKVKLYLWPWEDGGVVCRKCSVRTQGWK
jgi:hypothetical protein